MVQANPNPNPTNLLTLSVNPIFPTAIIVSRNRK